MRRNDLLRSGRTEREFPVALGVIRDVKDVTYDDGVRDQVKDVMTKSKIHCMDDLPHSGSIWEVK